MSLNSFKKASPQTGRAKIVKFSRKSPLISEIRENAPYALKVLRRFDNGKEGRKLIGVSRTGPKSFSVEYSLDGVFREKEINDDAGVEGFQLPPRTMKVKKGIVFHKPSGIREMFGIVGRETYWVEQTPGEFQIDHRKMAEELKSISKLGETGDRVDSEFKRIIQTPKRIKMKIMNGALWVAGAAFVAVIVAFGAARTTEVGNAFLEWAAPSRPGIESEFEEKAWKIMDGEVVYNRRKYDFSQRAHMYFRDEGKPYVDSDGEKVAGAGIRSLKGFQSSKLGKYAVVAAALEFGEYMGYDGKEMEKIDEFIKNAAEGRNADLNVVLIDFIGKGYLKKVISSYYQTNDPDSKIKSMTKDDWLGLFCDYGAVAGKSLTNMKKGNPIDAFFKYKFSEAIRSYPEINEKDVLASYAEGGEKAIDAKIKFFAFSYVNSFASKRRLELGVKGTFQPAKRPQVIPFVDANPNRRASLRSVYELFDSVGDDEFFALFPEIRGSFEYDEIENVLYYADMAPEKYFLMAVKCSKNEMEAAKKYILDVKESVEGLVN